MFTPTTEFFGEEEHPMAVAEQIIKLTTSRFLKKTLTRKLNTRLQFAESKRFCKIDYRFTAVFLYKLQFAFGFGTGLQIGV